MSKKLAEEFKGKAKIAKLDVDQAPKTSEKFNIRSIPTLIVFKDGKPVKTFVGLTKGKDLAAAVNSAL